MLNILDKKGNELAVVLEVKDYARLHETIFFSKPEESLQVGSVFFTKDSIVEPHIHRKKEVGTAYPIVEFILILSGLGVEVDIYDEEKELVKTLALTAGTIILLKRGGHGFRFPNSNTRLLDIRCGQYVDKATDKEMIR